MPTFFSRSLLIVVAAFPALTNCASQAAAQQQDQATASPSSSAWTLEQALAHLKLYPRDAYVQFVALQLARNEGRLNEVASQLQRLSPLRNQRNQRRNQIDLFSIFSGQLAVQESLQLDAMLPDDAAAGAATPPDVDGRSGPLPIVRPGRNRLERPRGQVAVSELEGPTIQSHPWQEMLEGKSPVVTGLALSVPADFYFVSFRSVNKLIDATELATSWGSHLLAQSKQEAKTQLVGQRIQQQLAIKADPELRPFYDAVVDEAALVGSDLFLREGSDVTMLFRVKQAILFRPKMDQFLADADNSRQNARRTTGKLLGVEFVHVATPDRSVHVYSAYPTPELHVRSNSLAALERVLEVIVGRSDGGRTIQPLGETDEFRYVRTLMPENAPEEDGLVYLSDPFVRSLMGPTLRLTERRRLVCYNHLRMIGHAALMHRTQIGELASSLSDLASAGCAPGEFGKGKFSCPEHGDYELAPDGLTGVCSHHGYASYLTPCLESPATQVTALEAEAYRRFVQQYSQYWRQFFDPIAIRLQITPEQYRAETIVLPLIDNTIYTSLARTLGGELESLDALPVPDRNIFSFAVRVNKAQLLQDMGLEQFIESEEPDREQLQAAANTREGAMAMKQILLGLLTYENAHSFFPPPEKNGLSWRVQILPFLEQGELYNQFHHNEPWDSEHNKKLIARIPEIYRPANEQLAAEGKTKLLVPRGPETLFPPGSKPFPTVDQPGRARNGSPRASDRVRGTSIASIRDGTSNTIALVEADDEHAVAWTKPDDIEIAPRDARRDLQIHSPGAFLAGMADGSVRLLREEIDPEMLAALLTRRGGEEIDRSDVPAVAVDFGSRGRFRARQAELFAQLRVGELLSKGVGNQIGFHVYDAEPMFDLALSRFMGMSLSSFRGGRGMNDQFLFLFPLVGALNGPVYVSIPVEDREIVDGFLDRLDGYLAELAMQGQQNMFFRIEQDFYQLARDGAGRPVRAYGFSVGPLKWRFFWTRIDDAVYIASKRDVLSELAALASDGDEAARSDASARSSRDDEAHALVRLRPQNWDQVLATYRLGWEENHRQACLQNLGPLSGLSRALTAGRDEASPVSMAEINQYARRVYDVHHFCPDEGAYEISPDALAVRCALHGTAQAPRQAEAPAEQSALGRQLRLFRDLSVKFSFLEDGLHAVVTLKRLPESASSQRPGQETP